MFRNVARWLGLSKPSKTEMVLRYPKRGMQAIAATKAAKIAARSPLATAIGAAVAAPLAVMTYRKVREEPE